MDSRGSFSQDTWCAKKFVSAIKDDPVSKYADIPVPIGGKRRRLEEANKDDSLSWYAEMVEHRFGRRAGQTIVVPVPGHADTSIAHIKRSRLWRIAELVAAKMRYSAEAGIHWKVAFKPARQGGERDASAIRANTVVNRKRLEGGHIILLDDVVTTAGHVRGCASALRAAGVDVVCALCVGRTVDAQEAKPFSWKRKNYPLIE